MAGTAFAFLPFRVSHLPHLQVLTCGWMPIALWSLHRYFATRSRAALVTLVVAYALQTASNLYYIYFLALPVGILAACELFWVRGWRKRAVLDVTIAAVAILITLAPVASVYYDVRNEQQQVRDRGSMVRYSADVASYSHPSAQLSLWGNVLPWGRPEAELFPGLLLSGLTLLGVVVVVSRPNLISARGPSPPRRTAVVYGVIGVTAFVLSLGPEPTAWGRQLTSLGPYDWLLAVVPGLDGLRVPARLAIVVYLAMGIFAAFAVTAIVRSVSFRMALPLAALLAALAFAEGYAPLHYAGFDPYRQAGDRDAYVWLEKAAPGAILELPTEAHEPVNTLHYQYRTLDHGHPIVNGSSGYSSPLFEYLKGSSSPLYDFQYYGDLLRGLRGLGVRYVIVHTSDFRDQRLATDIIEAIGLERGQLLAEWQFGRTTVFWLAETPAETSRNDERLFRIPRADMSVAVSHGGDRTDSMLDGNLDTRWLTAHNQEGGERIEITFDRTRDVGQVRLQMAWRGLGDYPRGLRIESSEDGEIFDVVYEGGVLTQLLRGIVSRGGYAPIDIALPTNRTRTLRILQTGTTRTGYWSIHELELSERH